MFMAMDIGAFHFENRGYGLYIKMMVFRNKKQVLFTEGINLTSIDSKLSFVFNNLRLNTKKSCSNHGCSFF